jgi:saccharopine dehydrogenase-like NADP-dependent oxidoreductase
MQLKAAIMGVGRMGTAICFAMNKLGFYVIGVDSNAQAADNFRKHITGPDGVFYLSKDSDFRHSLTLEKPDVVISSLPYHQTEEIAQWCIAQGVRYCDLGGRVDVSKSINDYANREARAPVFTDLGLAPGWVNILAEHGLKEIHTQVDDVSMMVGGLPGIPSNPPLNYAVTWSTDGLINEYADDCEILLNGEIESVPGMSGLENVYLDLLQDEVEAFYTSGGASHTLESMKRKGVKNCSYKTLRWKGHCEAVRFLIKQCSLSDECLLDIFKNGCVDTGGDIVLIRALVRSGDSVNGLQWKREKVVASDADGRFSAMQKATAYPISSVAALMAKGIFDGKKEQHRDYWIDFPKALKYEDVPLKEFNENLNKLGVQNDD